MNYEVCWVGDERFTVKRLVCESVKDSSNLSLKLKIQNLVLTIITILNKINFLTKI